MEACSVKMNLLELWHNSARAHAEAVARLDQTVGISAKSEYDVLCRVAEALRAHAVEAQEQLNAHVHTHGC